MSDLGHLINHPTSKNGTIEQEEEDTEVELFKNALDFSKVKVRDCMIPRTDIEALELTSGIEELREKFIDTGFSKYLFTTTMLTYNWVRAFITDVQNPQKNKRSTPRSFICP
jgi:CBS domain containing-hemolysin-like protein